MNERDVEISKREAKKKERRSRKDKLAIEKRILRLSFMGSVFFILAEGAISCIDMSATAIFIGSILFPVYVFIVAISQSPYPYLSAF